MDLKVRTEQIDDNNKIEVIIKQEEELLIENDNYCGEDDGYYQDYGLSEEKGDRTPKPKRKRCCWNEGSEAALLDLWPERVEALRAQKKTGYIYAEMADDLCKLGYTCSPRDVQVKVQNFTQRYRKEKAMMGGVDGSTSTWCLYEKVHQIIGGVKTNPTEVMFESTDDVSISSNSALLTITPLPSSSPLLPVPRNKSQPSKKREKKKGISSFLNTVLQNFESVSHDIAEHLKKSEEIEKELVEIEKQKANSLEKIARDNEELNTALVAFLNKNS